jgi:hypothetical protein
MGRRRPNAAHWNLFDFRDVSLRSLLSAVYSSGRPRLFRGLAARSFLRLLEGVVGGVGEGLAGGVEKVLGPAIIPSYLAQELL